MDGGGARLNYGKIGSVQFGYFNFSGIATDAN
jgi:hypothetical protein